MEPNDLSPSTIENEKLIEGDSSMILELAKKSVKLSIAINNYLTQNPNQGLQKFYETSLNPKFNPFDEDESLEEPEARSSVSTTGEDSASNISLAVGGENLRTSQSMVSSTSTDATCGSSEVVSLEDEPLWDLEDTRERLESGKVWDLDNPLLGLPRGAVKHISDSPARTSSSGTTYKSRITNPALNSDKGSLFKEDSKSLKLPDVCNSLDAPLLRPKRRPSKQKKAEESSFQEESKSLKLPDVCSNLDVPGLLPKRRPSKHIKGEESPSNKPLSSTLPCFSNKEILFTLEDAITVPPLVSCASSFNTREDKVPKNFSDSSVRACSTDYKRIRKNYQKEDESVRKKAKRVPAISSKTNSRPTSSSEPSISGSSRKDGCSLLQLSKSLKHTSPEEDDWDIYESAGKFGEVETESPTSSETNSDESLSPEPIPIPRSVRNVGHSLMQISKSLEDTLPEINWEVLESFSISNEVRYFPQNSLENDLMSFCLQTKNAATTPRLDTESLLKEVNNFFKDNRVDADKNLSLKERKDRIIASKYFNDDFCRRHGLLSQDEVLKERLKEIESYTSPNLSRELEFLEICKILTERGVTEEEFVEYFKTHICHINIKGNESASVSGPSNGERDNYVRREITSIRKEYHISHILDLYQRVTREGATFLSILLGSRKLSAPMERSLYRGLLDIAENWSQDSSDRSPISTDHRPLNRTITQNDETDNTVCQSSNESDVSRKDESATKSSEMHSRESEAISNVDSMSESNVLDSLSLENELCNEKTPLSAINATKTLESSVEEETGKDGSNVCVEDLDSKVNGAGDDSEE